MLIIKWKDTNGKWNDFYLDDILHMSRTHAINLFSMGIPVVIKQDDQYIVNKVDLFADYKKSRKQVIMLSDCKPSSEPLAEVGFL
jgi:hypothetical protein